METKELCRCLWSSAEEQEVLPLGQLSAQNGL